MRIPPFTDAATASTSASQTSVKTDGKPSDAYLARLWHSQGTSMAGPYGDLYEKSLAAATAKHRAALDEWVGRNVPWAKQG